MTKDGAFIEGATEDQIAKAHREQEGYAISLEKLDAAVDELVEALLQQFPECTRYTKQQVNFWKDLAWHQTIGHAGDWLALHYSSMEPWEGMRAFVQKRKPRYMELRERAASGGSSEFVWGPPAVDCPECGAEGIPESFRYCGACGAELGGNGAGAGRVEDAETAPAGG
ncbi:MAG: hypothetical protein GWM90_20300 [Gemmatimonadetes bacterium]|nr:hypothetical protein [Gemmatimonadota bacterium]NIQ56805.1 hypothetical protein [Gemmatimonadota bacterium]NIX46340.1 hypothetical protein [Gemmatimonadota bacterium]NIY10664.1 hypothetical protein [Gemmatimonadota bacterium]